MAGWLTLAELAALALPGLPATRQGWDEFVARAGWSVQQTPDKVRERRARGGGLEFHVTLLSQTMQAQIAARQAGAAVLPENLSLCAALAPGAENMTSPALEARDARLVLVAAADHYSAAVSLPLKDADRSFCALYNLGKITVDDWVRDAVGEVSKRTLDRWRGLLRRNAHTQLGVDRGMARRGKGFFDTAADGSVRQFALALIAHQPHLSAYHVRMILADKFPSLTLPPVRTVSQFLKRLKEDNLVLLTRATSPDAFKSRYRLSGANAHRVTRLNELWMIDASPADMLTVAGRQTVYLCLDIFSRRIIIHITETARADAVALLMRKAILAWGIPERVKTDNGSDFVAKTTRRLFLSLGIEAETSSPFSPEQKGHVERAIGTYQRDLMPLLPGFIGHSVADRKVIEARKTFSARLGESDAQAFAVDLTAEELQKYSDQWAQAYANRPHAGLGGKTPFTQAASYGGPVRRIENARALDMLLAPIAGKDGLRTLTKQGIKIDGSFYLCGSILPGTTVLVRMDPQDLGHVFCFEPDGHVFLGEAVCPELAGVDPAAAVAQARKAQKQLLSEGMRQLRADMRQIRPRDMVDAVMRQSAMDSGKLVEFPRAQEAHITPALLAAASVFDAPALPEQTAGQRSAMAAIEADISASPSPPVATLPETPRFRFRRACALEADLAAGVKISTADALWLGGYQAGAEYRTEKILAEDFGEAALR